MPLWHVVLLPPRVQGRHTGGERVLNPNAVAHEAARVLIRRAVTRRALHFYAQRLCAWELACICHAFVTNHTLHIEPQHQNPTQLEFAGNFGLQLLKPSNPLCMTLTMHISLLNIPPAATSRPPARRGRGGHGAGAAACHAQLLPGHAPGAAAAGNRATAAAGWAAAVM